MCTRKGRKGRGEGGGGVVVSIVGSLGGCELTELCTKYGDEDYCGKYPELQNE